MVGENGALKLGNKWVITREVQRRSTRLDDVVDGQDEVCLLKARARAGDTAHGCGEAHLCVFSATQGGC